MKPTPPQNVQEKPALQGEQVPVEQGARAEWLLWTSDGGQSPVL